MKLNIEPLKALCDKKINIYVSELIPYSKVKISATMKLPWQKKGHFESYAVFSATSDGSLDLSKQKPESGTYDFADSMGLIVSMDLIDGDLNDIAANIFIENSLFIDIKVESEQEVKAVRIERKFKDAKVKMKSIKDEFIGELFYTENPNNKTIVVLGGSDGNGNANYLIAGPLASHGFNVLSVEYFNNETLPKNLAKIPLEYFEKVFEWLKKNPITKCDEVYIHGTSKGGELALLLASRYKFIKKVVAVAPHAYCFEAIKEKNVSSWSYRGQSIPFIKLKNSIMYKDILKCFIKNKSFGYAYTYKTCLDNATNKDEARIKIEKSEADIMLIAGKEDMIWNCYEGCNEVINNLSKSNYNHKYVFLSYEEAGHPFPVPYIMPIKVTQSVKILPRLRLTVGGTLKGNYKLQEESWTKILEFLKEN